MCFPVRKKSGRSSLALAVWNSSLSLKRHSSSSSRRPTAWRRELRSAQITHRVAPGGETGQGRDGGETGQGRDGGKRDWLGRAKYCGKDHKIDFEIIIKLLMCVFQIIR